MSTTDIDHELRVTGRPRAPWPVPSVASYGIWTPYLWDNDGTPQHGVILTPDHAPWRDLFAALDDAGTSQAGAPVTPLEEADAMTGACWRYGSYFHLLTAGEAYPPFRGNRNLSRLGDWEMQRINLEFSSGLAAWLEDRAHDPEITNRRTRAALSLLPTPWRAGRSEWLDEWIVSDARDLAATVQARLAELPSLSPLDDRLTVRHEANYLALDVYRNGPIENLHAGYWSHGTEIPGFQRFDAPEVTKLAAHAAYRLAHRLLWRADARMTDIYPRLWDVPSWRGWSLTEETAGVKFSGMPGAGSVVPRLRWLADRVSAVYGSVRDVEGPTPRFLN
jgi:hypothetical protein